MLSCKLGMTYPFYSIFLPAGVATGIPEKIAVFVEQEVALTLNLYEFSISLIWIDFIV